MLYFPCLIMDASVHCNTCKSAPACPQRFGQLRCTTWQPMQGLTGRSYKVHIKPVAKAISHFVALLARLE